MQKHSITFCTTCVFCVKNIFTKGVLAIGNTKSRKYQLTFNNPEEHSVSHNSINETMKNIRWDYYCLCDEIGDSGTPHIHLFFNCVNAVSFDRVKKLFPSAHIETARGSCQENRDYIRKEGKYLDSEKKESNIIETFEEFGIIPLDKSAKNETISSQVLEMIENGCSNTEIIRAYPSYSTKINHLERTRQTLLEDKNKDNWRDVMTTYIFGETATGKTRFVMEKYGYSNVYRVTNYKNPFDGYAGQDVILFDEFRSSLPLADMLLYLDGYPFSLPARFSDKVACFTKVYIISNIDLNKQYPNIQNEETASWNALIRRINAVIEFRRNLPFSDSDGETERIIHNIEDYFKEV